MFQLQTPRLTLRDFVTDDWQTIYEMSQEPAVTRYQSVLRLESADKARQWVQNGILYNNQQPREAYNLLVEERAQRRALGWIGWGNAADPREGEFNFGYALLPEFWGRGYMTEAVRAMLVILFGTRGARRVSACCESTNLPSARVMEKAGMSLVERWTEESESYGTVECLRYSLLWAAWTRDQGGRGE